MCRSIEKICAATVLLCLLLTGCLSNSYPEELYRLPRLPSEYASLETMLDELLASGAEHAAPTSGSNLQSVQMVDLDGDGAEEAVAFFRKADDEKPMKVYFFRKAEECYEQFALIEGAASSLYSISYSDLDGDGWREIIIGLKNGTEVQVLSVYSLLFGKMQNILTTAYSRYAISDLDGDGKQELTVFYSGAENDCMADCYACVRNEMVKRSTRTLSFSASELSRVSAGTLTGGERALFATGVAESSEAINDVLLLQDGTLKNIAPHTEEAHRFLSLYPSDVDGDGVTEVPEAVNTALSETDPDGCYRVCWRSYSADGKSRIMCNMFYDEADGWRLELPSGWIDTVSAQRMATANECTVTFFRRAADEEGDGLLAIRMLTGRNHEAAEERDGIIVLARQVDTVFTAELLHDTDEPDGKTVQELFSLIAAEWATGEN